MNDISKNDMIGYRLEHINELKDQIDFDDAAPHIFDQIYNNLCWVESLMEKRCERVTNDQNSIL